VIIEKEEEKSDNEILLEEKITELKDERALN
jgi:hypothetical protein